MAKKRIKLYLNQEFYRRCCLDSLFKRHNFLECLFIKKSHPLLYIDCFMSYVTLIVKFINSFKSVSKTDVCEIMNIGYMRVSKNDGSQVLDLQYDALIKASVSKEHIYEDKTSGAKESRPGLDACLKALRPGDVLIVWKLDRLGRNLRHLVNLVGQFSSDKIGFKVLAGHGADINTTTAAGKLVFGIFAALAEFERDIISERTKAGLVAARARGRMGGRSFALSKAQVRLLQASMGEPETNVRELSEELKISKATIYRYVDGKGNLRPAGEKALGVKN